MKFSEVFTSKDNIQLDKKTLVILRWIALVGQYLTISIVYFIFQFDHVIILRDASYKSTEAIILKNLSHTLGC